jgi:hypothetical protein
MTFSRKFEQPFVAIDSYDTSLRPNHSGNSGRNRSRAAANVQYR